MSGRIERAYLHEVLCCKYHSAHNYDVWFSPRQMILDPNLYPGRMNPTLDFVDSFEDYTDDGTGTPKPISTRVDGNESDL